MAINPGIGDSGGQHYDIVRAIQTFLGQMAEGGIGVAAAVIKELLQNADDAGASEISVILDERKVPANLPEDYRPLLGPAILVRNNSPFRLKEEVDANEKDDFTAICDVASGHKRAQATAAGRFGIGFNSVYFLTDTPVLFSRREVHVFDLLHRVFDGNGWRFPLDDFPKESGSVAGAAKNVVQWLLPNAALGEHSFENVANSADGDFKEAVVRLPLRVTAEGLDTLYPDRFRADSDRERVLHEMAEQTAMSVLFLKNLRSATFWKLGPDGRKQLHVISASQPPAAFQTFLSEIKLHADSEEATKLECDFDRRVTWQDVSKNTKVEWNFWVRHWADFSDDALRQIRVRLKNNGERAIPWGAVAVPMDAASVQLEGEIPAWRVFLPLREVGPSACVFCGAFFVGPSRQHTEFRVVGSDEAMRKTDWNKMLVEKVLVPLLVDASLGLPDRIPNLISEHPKLYLSLFPRAPASTKADSSLAEHFQQRFSEQSWALRLFDIWDSRDNPVEWLVGDEDASPTIEMIPEWMLKYRDRFATLSNDQRRFVKWSVGDALRERVAKSSHAKIRRDVADDVVREILGHDMPPEPTDLKPLLERLTPSAGLDSNTLDGLWALASTENDKALRYSKQFLYVVGARDGEAAIHKSLRQLGLDFEDTEWVKQEIGIPKIAEERRGEILNLTSADASGALQLLSRVKNAKHDFLAQSRLITPIIDFLVTMPANRLATGELKLSFLVRTADNKADRRKFGVILLKPETPSEDETAVWEGLFRRTLAEVDSECAKNLHRLLKCQTDIIRSLADDECVLKISTSGNWLSILDSARSHCPDIVEALRARLNQPSITAADSSQIRRGISAVIREAVLNWDRLSPAEQETILALPIHRTSAGKFVSLIGPGIGDSTTVVERFRIQSSDDISDAPVALSDCCLLDSAEPSAKRLYREILRLYEHGRVAVLMDVLRQVGSAGDKNVPMLVYLGRYMHETLDRLAESMDEAERKDAAELKNLTHAAKSVPCIDGEWRTATMCRDGWAVVKHLESQGWKPSDVKSILPKLFPEVTIAAVDERSRKLLQRVHPDLACLEPREVANRAVTSESTSLDLVDRLKLSFDNRNDLSDDLKPAKSVSHFKMSTISGTDRAVSGAVIRAVKKNELSSGLLQMLAPETVDIASLASQISKRFSLVAKGQEEIRKQLPNLLEVLGVPKLDEPGIRQRVANNFGTLWPSLNDDHRLELLEFVHNYDLIEDLKQVATNLQTVRVCGNQEKASKWASPNQVISPTWIKSKPPCVSPGICAAITGISESVRQVWDSWCGINCFESVAAHVVESAAKSAAAAQSQAASQLYRWLDLVHGSKHTERDEFIRTLRGLQWVLARQSANTGYKRPAEVLIHAGEAILSREFWVAEASVSLPLCCSNSDSQIELGFLNELLPSADIIQRIAKCLEYSAGVDRAAAIAVYRVVASLIEESDELKTCWRIAAMERPVFRLFRDRNERVVPALSVFVGNDENSEDFGELLFCLRGVEPSPESVIVSLFKKLLVPECPKPEQLSSALSKLEGSVDLLRPTYHSLIDALLKSWSELTDIQVQTTRQIRIATCTGNFRPLSECYWDEMLSDPTKLDQRSRQRMIDGTDASTRQLIDHLLARTSNVVQLLSLVATGVLSPEPQVVVESPAIRELLEPWRSWFADIGKPDSILHDQAKNCGLVIPSTGVQFVAVKRIPVCFVLPNEEAIWASADWAGPVALCLDGKRIFVRADELSDDLATDVRRLESVDLAIRKQVVSLNSTGQLQPNVDRENALAFIKETVERPSVVLDRLRATTERNYFYKYNDQAADPDFATLHDQYVRTQEGSKRHQELAKKLRAIVRQKFVTMRREQIRAYGYDEFSVFAELVQNAEDAYTQRQLLGLNEPPHWSVAFRFQRENESTTLSVEHYGRPFNFWRYGGRQVESFRKDVEGVLRSSGSFKPYSQTDEGASQVIGKFGLGFKSVYLLTDCPSIYSGGWNFQIEDGCMPVAVARPNDLCTEATRISLPLLDPDREILDAGSQHALCLLPFLRQTEQISITHSNAHATAATRRVEELQRQVSNGQIAELVTIEVSDGDKSHKVRIIRVRNTNHAGQLAMFLASDDLPAAWSDGFSRKSGFGQSSTCDFYSSLPLKSELGCGVAVSHHFDLQSGRTHLVDSEANMECAAQIADLLPCLTDAIPLVGDEKVVSERLMRFWSVWRWDRGDAETKFFRECLAKQLVQLSRHNSIAPTLDVEKAVSLSEQPLFNFCGVPQPVVDALVAAGFRFERGSGNGPMPTVLAYGNILVPGFVRAFRRVCEFVPNHKIADWFDVDWALVGETCTKTPWLATHPMILNAIAESASEDASKEIGTWLAECHILGRDGDGNQVRAVPRDLLIQSEDVRSLLPARFFKFVDSLAYNQYSLDLLAMAGMSESPASRDLLVMVCAQDLTPAEAVRVLQYLQAQKRWRCYDGIRSQLQDPWFPSPRGRVTVNDAIAATLLDESLLLDDEFKAWLGLRETSSEPPPLAPEQRNASDILLDLHDWWQQNGVEWTEVFERRTYISGHAPDLSLAPDLNDRPQRKQWLSVFLLGACHTIGRTKPEQHRGFLQLCQQYNWLDTFANKDSSAQEWIDLLETYLNQPTNDIPYYQWAKLFVPMFHLSRWLDEYVHQFAGISKRASFRLDQITSPRRDSASSGGGRDAPSIRQTLGIGACFVVRELCRLKVVNSEPAHEHCYVPSERVRDLLEHHIADEKLFLDRTTSPAQSKVIYDFLFKKLDEKAIFDGSFDLPLLALCEDPELQEEILGYVIK